MIARLYLRVSTEEQVKYGFSLDAQLEDLKNYCKSNNYSIAGIYKDEGISASTIKKRKEFMRMLEEVKPGEIILFTKLDRFSRNLLDANLVIKDLEKKNVSIKAIQEDDIDTTTADGKFMFNIRLSIAEREREKTGERIKDVFKYKVTKGEVITGALPIGYKIENKKVVIDPDKKDMVIDIFNTYEKKQSYRQLCFYLKDKYNYSITPLTVKKILSNSLYIGQYRNNLNYCSGIIPKEQFERIQGILRAKNIKYSPINNIYLFTGLLIDTNCGGKLTGSRGKTYPYYRCIKYRMNRSCNCSKVINENYIESYLLKQIEFELDKYDKILVKRYKEKSKPVNTTAIKKEIDRLNILFQKGRISEEYYDKEYIKLEKQLRVPKAKRRIDLPTNWRDVYNSLSKEGKRTFWRSFIERIEVDPFTKDIRIIFL